MIVKTDRPLSANEQLLDRAIAHAHYFERLKTFEARRVVGFLNNDLLPDLVDRVSSRLERMRTRGLDAEITRNVGYRELIGGMRDILDAGMRRLSDQVAESLVDIGASEAQWQANTIERVTGPQIRFEFDMPSVSTLRSIVTSRPMQGRILRDWFKDLGKTTQARVTREINLGIASSESIDDIVRRIRGTRDARYTDGVLQITRRNAESVVRTAVNHVSTHAREELYGANDDIVKGVQIVATLDTRTTDLCKGLDGKIYAPGEGGRPPFHYGCLSGDVVVSSTTPVTGCSKRWFKGDVVVIRTASGRHLTCTPNHPVLTDRGWVPAGQLDERHHVISYGRRDGVSPRRVDHQYEPARIEQFARAFLESSGVQSAPVPTTAEDFHGDGMDGEVAVVGTNRLLRFERDTALAQYPFESLLVSRPAVARLVSLSRRGRETHLLASLLAPTRSSVRSRRDARDLSVVGGGHSSGLLLAAVAGLATRSAKRARYDVRAALELFGNSAHADSAVEELEHLLGREHTALFEGAGSHRHASLAQHAEHGLRSDAELARYLTSGAAGEVFADHVVHVEVRHFADHVYNLETDGGFYVAGGVIVHNCRTTTIPILKSWKELGLGLKELAPATRASMDGQVPGATTYAEWLARQSADRQDQALGGPGRGALYRRGAVTIDRFVDGRGRPLSLRELEQLEAREAA